MVNPVPPRTVDVVLLDEEGAAAIVRDDGVETIADDEGGRLPRRAVLQADGSVRLALLHPVTLAYKQGANGTVKEETYADLHFRRLNGADMRAISETEGSSRAVVAIARSARLHAGLMHRVYDRMDASDIVAAGAVVEHFLGGGRTTGR